LPDPSLSPGPQSPRDSRPADLPVLGPFAESTNTPPQVDLDVVG